MPKEKPLNDINSFVPIAAESLYIRICTDFEVVDLLFKVGTYLVRYIRDKIRYIGILICNAIFFELIQFLSRMPGHSIIFAKSVLASLINDHYK